MPVSEIHIDPFLPRLAEGTPKSVLTVEQDWYIREILSLTSSDTRSADKAYLSILLVLGVSGESGPVSPVIESLSPDSFTIGGPDFTLVVTGTNFTATSKVYIRGNEVPTVFVSPTELNVAVESALIVGAGVAPVMVIDGGRASTPVNFTVMEPAPPLSSRARK